MARRRKWAGGFLGGIIGFAVVFGLAFFGFQFFTKTGVFKVPGVVSYDESLNTAERAVLAQIFTDEIELDKDVAISAKNYLNLPELQENDFLYEILVPVSDFYSSETDIAAESAEELLEKLDGGVATSEESASEIADNGGEDSTKNRLISVMDLDFSQKLLSVNEHYYLDEFTEGAIYRVISFESEKFDEEIRPLVEKDFTKTWPAKDSVLTMAQTGVTALSRGMNEKLTATGGDATYFSAEIKDFLSSFDLTHTSNESSFSNFATSRNICSDTRFINTLTDIGLDIVELTGNHNQDCGDEAAKNTIDIYAENNIQMVGGGKTATEAAKPLEIDEKNTGITFLAYNLSTGGATDDDTPGANRYSEDNATAEIAAAKERGDFVIIDIQYYECNAYASEYEDPTCDYADSAAGDQVGFFRHLIDLGADVVVGTSAHQPQTFELYGDGVIYYGLGNLFFDQVWWPGTTRSLVLGHYFYNGKLLQTKITPTVYGAEMQTKVMDEETAAWFLNRLISVRP